jgi:carboxyl-terminal processing protease
MARRNLFWLIAVSVVSLVCYQKVQNNRYGRILVDAMGQIERRYVEPVTSEALFAGAMDGMMRKLDDPYSDYISPEMLKALNATLEQEFGGVGIEVTMDPQTKQLTVIAPMAGTPADRADMRAGDKILRIGDRSTQGLSLEDAVRLMRGKKGEPVVLTVLHEGDQKPVEIKLVREIIHVDSVTGDRRNPDGTWNFFLEGPDRIGYVRINTFAKETVGELKRALSWLVDHDMQGLVLDLRGNAGGLLKAAIDVCDQFIDAGVIVTIRGRDQKEIRPPYEADGKGAFVSFPLAVLVNRGSASASEIVAACLQDHERAVIVGERTYGKGTVQEVIDLPDDLGALKLTTATYWRPSGKDINKRKNVGEAGEWGVQPDKGYEVKVEPEELARLRMQRLNRELHKRPGNGAEPPGKGAEPVVDRQLAKAVEYIKAKLRSKED